MRVRYDWVKLKNQFIVGGWVTMADFLRDNKIKNNSRNRLNTRGWKEERVRYLNNIVTRTQNVSVETEVEIRLRQQQLAKKMQIKGLEKLDELPIESADDARKMIIAGLQEERIAIGLEGGKSSNQNLTQVNVNLPKTKFDEMLDGKSFEELLEFLVAIRKEKERRRLLKNTSE